MRTDPSWLCRPGPGKPPKTLVDSHQLVPGEDQPDHPEAYEVDEGGQTFSSPPRCWLHWGLLHWYWWSPIRPVDRQAPDTHPVLHHTSSHQWRSLCTTELARQNPPRGQATVVARQSSICTLVLSPRWWLQPQWRSGSMDTPKTTPRSKGSPSNPDIAWWPILGTFRLPSFWWCWSSRTHAARPLALWPWSFPANHRRCWPQQRRQHQQWNDAFTMPPTQTCLHHWQTALHLEHPGLHPGRWIWTRDSKSWVRWTPGLAGDPAPTRGIASLSPWNSLGSSTGPTSTRSWKHIGSTTIEPCWTSCWRSSPWSGYQAHTPTQPGGQFRQSLRTSYHSMSRPGPVSQRVLRSLSVWQSETMRRLSSQLPQRHGVLFWQPLPPRCWRSPQDLQRISPAGSPAVWNLVPGFGTRLSHAFTILITLQGLPCGGTIASLSEQPALYGALTEPQTRSVSWPDSS